MVTINLSKQLANILITLAALIPLTHAVAFADDIYKGVKRPINWQVDGRINYSRKDDTSNKGDSIETLTNTLILKYWNGDAFGVFGFKAEHACSWGNSACANLYAARQLSYELDKGIIVTIIPDRV